MPAPTVLDPHPEPITTAPPPLPGYEVFLTSDETAAWLRVAPETFRQWRKRGIAPPHERLLSGAIRYLPSRVMDWIIEQRGTAA